VILTQEVERALSELLRSGGRRRHRR